jgi:drug/metabolite transporter (DMT)-like permease
MKTRDVLAAISSAIVWGLTFIAIKIGVGERLGPFELWGAVLVMAGLGFNLFGDRLLRHRSPSFW